MPDYAALAQQIADQWRTGQGGDPSQQIYGPQQEIQNALRSGLTPELVTQFLGQYAQGAGGSAYDAMQHGGAGTALSAYARAQTGRTANGIPVSQRNLARGLAVYGGANPGGAGYGVSRGGRPSWAPEHEFASGPPGLRGPGGDGRATGNPAGGGQGIAIGEPDPTGRPNPMPMGGGFTSPGLNPNGPVAGSGDGLTGTQSGPQGAPGSLEVPLGWTRDSGPMTPPPRPPGSGNAPQTGGTITNTYQPPPLTSPTQTLGGGGIPLGGGTTATLDGSGDSTQKRLYNPFANYFRGGAAF